MRIGDGMTFFLAVNKYLRYVKALFVTNKSRLDYDWVKMTDFKNDADILEDYNFIPCTHSSTSIDFTLKKKFSLNIKYIPSNIHSYKKYHSQRRYDVITIILYNSKKCLYNIMIVSFVCVCGGWWRWIHDTGRFPYDTIRIKDTDDMNNLNGVIFLLSFAIMNYFARKYFLEIPINGWSRAKKVGLHLSGC